MYSMFLGSKVMKSILPFVDIIKPFVNISLVITLCYFVGIVSAINLNVSLC
jgi:hypothetical protein